MSVDAVHGFISKVGQDPELSAMVTNSLAGKSDVDIVELAGKHGFVFSAEEGLRVWKEVQAKGELPDSALDVIAGGGVPTDAGANK